MRRFMCEAEVGDEQQREDPTVNLLQDMVAELLGKEAALFLPSGTMCNQVAFAVHCRAGDEILLQELAHPLLFEVGGPAALVGAVLRPLRRARGLLQRRPGASDAIRPPAYYMPRTRAVSIEQTSNVAGGVCWPLAQIEAVCAAAHDAGLVAHMDGARLFNAVVASGTAARSVRGAVRLASGSTSARDWGPDGRGAGRISRLSSRRPGASSSGSAAPCGRPASLRPPASTPSGTTWTGWPRIMSGRGGWPGPRDDSRVGTRPGSGGDQHRDLRCAPDRPDRREPSAPAPSRATASGSACSGPTTVRAVTHLDIPPDGIERALRQPARRSAAEPVRMFQSDIRCKSGATRRPTSCHARRTPSQAGADP